MRWEQLLSLKRQGDTNKRLRTEENDTRLGFEVDYDRIIFSQTFRSLQDKTQVIPLSKTDFVHNRLTHSLEVSVVGRSLGRLVGKQILEKYPHLATMHGYQMNDFGAIVAAACLSHDIGNPPFGHSGEKAIGEFFSIGNGKQYKNQLSSKQWQDLVDFEGNANGFSVLTASRPGVEGGLRLTYATLGTFAKYPKESLPKKPTKSIVDKKFGFFQSDKTFFEEVAQELGLIPNKSGDDIGFVRHPLAFLVEAADDICYTIIDFEDGINLGWIPEEFALEYLIKLVPHIDTQKYHSLTTKEDRISYLRALTIGNLIQEAAQLFMTYESEILMGTFDTSLIEKSKFKAQMKDIIQLSIQNIYQSPQVIEKELKGYQIIHRLLDVFTLAVNRTYEGNPTSFDRLTIQLMPEKYREIPDDLYERLMMVCRFVSLLTDGKALELNQTVSNL
jgi:dGTPase